MYFLKLKPLKNIDKKGYMNDYSRADCKKYFKIIIFYCKIFKKLQSTYITISLA